MTVAGPDHYSAGAGRSRERLQPLGSVRGHDLRLTGRPSPWGREAGTLPGAGYGVPDDGRAGESLAALIEAQPYVSAVDWKAAPEGVNLDAWRHHYQGHLNLCDMVCECFGLPHPPREQPWLFVEPRRESRVVFHRSSRYHNWNFPWRRAYERYHRDAAFVGLPEEHRDFSDYVGPVSYLHTEDMLELARVIAGAELFVGNQSSPFAVAEGLKVPTVLEIYCSMNNCHWERRGNIHGWGEDVWLPELDELPERLVRSVIARGGGPLADYRGPAGGHRPGCAGHRASPRRHGGTRRVPGRVGEGHCRDGAGEDAAPVRHLPRPPGRRLAAGRP